MVSTRPAYRPPAPPRSHRLPKHVYWRRRAITLLSIVTLVVFSYLGVTLVMALNNPSFGVSSMARIAEWGRQHGIGGFVTWAETEYYKLHPPKKGGAPPLSAFGSGATSVHIPKGNHLAPPSTIPSPAGTALPGEGVWHVAGRTTANGTPTVYEAFVRPNAVNTSYVVGVAWMDPTLLKAQLYSGSQIPGGGPFKYTAPITPAASTTLVAAFNAGFRMQDAHGGYYTQGKMLLPLRQGAASVVIFKDGTMTVGAWGEGGLTMGNQIEAVRQNLDLIVQNGQPVAGLDAAHSLKWGATLGGTFNVWRSGLGVTKDGALIYVGGPSLSISDLANVLVRAGAVRAMELDINTDWVQYTTYQGPLGSAVNGANGTDLLSSMNGNPGRFFANWWVRDFFTMSLRPNELSSATASKSNATSSVTPAG
ncbi:MAG TPA: phosphodiester glycosidase family protein [Acidimicrobiales bacterium]